MRKVLLIGSLGMITGLWGCFAHAKEEEKPEPETFTVTTPLQIDTIVTKDYVAQIRSVRNIEVRTQEKGYLQNIYVDEGQYVHAGQILFRIMPRLYQAEYQKASAETKAAEIEYQNTKILADKNIVSKNELALSRAKLEGARAETQLAKTHLSFTEIRAPFSGTIDRIPKKLGSLLDEGELLTSLSDNAQMFAYFNVSEPEYLDYQMHSDKRGSRNVQLLLANGQPLPVSGVVETIESEFDHETGNIAFRARFSNPNKLLRNGETGKVLMTVPLPAALVIPQKCTYEIQDKKYVFVVDNRGIVSSKNITVAASLPDLYVVNGGLSPTEKVLVEGVQKVKDDVQIKPKYVAPRQVIEKLKLHTE